MKEKAKALVLFSGGLDSRLVVKILQEQNIAVECLYFKMPFGCGCCNDTLCNFNYSQMQGVKLTIFDCTKGKLFKEYLKMLQHPKFGRGSSMNPCIDCKIFMFKKAKDYADKQKPKIKIIATGEVLGERPMSQTSNAMSKIDNEIGFELLRPLSAKLLRETQAEKEKLVDRNKLFDIQGRNRRIQLELAKKYKIRFPMPGGGCLLCEKTYKPRIQDLLKSSKNQNISPEKLKTLESFRHFKSIQTKSKIILGRNHQENLELENLNKKLKYNIMKSPQDRPGPTALYEDKKDKSLAEELIKAYADKNLEERKKFESMKL